MLKIRTFGYENKVAQSLRMIPTQESLTSLPMICRGVSACRAGPRQFSRLCDRVLEQVSMYANIADTGAQPVVRQGTDDFARSSGHGFQCETLELRNAS